ncbi:InlB B-repeat-containing protein [Streptococcus equinus]|uniref:InlB B-repeat-containing protein n=1 Tax=Streptococcus equinus TaxID=1335 RepID=UPI001F1CCD0D|nr:InlB B-repeat-containing protein [Streptococcus equinus]
MPALTLDNETANSQAGIEVEQSSQQGQSLPSLASPQDNNLGSSIVGSQPNSVEQGNTQTDTSEPDLITQATTLTASNQDYTITADVDEKAQLPKDTTLIVKEVKSDDSAYQGNYQKAQETLIGKIIESVLFYDISFESKGEKVEPQADVKVTIKPSQAMDSKDNFDVLHFADDGSEETITQKDVKEIDHKITSVAFDNSQFSTYALVTSSNPSENKTSLDKSGGPSRTTLHTVTFKYTDNDGVEHEMTSAQIADGETISVFPTPVYREGYRFTKWVNQADGTTVTDTTPISGDMTIVAQYSEIKIYNVTIQYYYHNNTSDTDTVFGNDIHNVEAKDTPYRVTPPPSVKPEDDTTVSPDEVYYPSQSIVELADATDLANKDAADGTVDKNITIRVQYVAADATYNIHYMLKNLNNNNYSEIESTQAHGVIGSTIRPQVLTYPYADFERTNSVTLTQAQGQDLYVYYTRKEFELSYNTNGGYYIEPTDGLYGESVAITSNVPQKKGYSFDGWYDNPELTGNKITGNVTLNSDMTLYAKWKADTVPYTIAYYKEVYDNATNTTHYVYDSAINRTGTVDTTVTASSAPDLAVVPKGYQRENASGGPNSTSSIVVAADGSSVLNVYYSLIRYTFVFDLNLSSIFQGGSLGRIDIGGQVYKGSEYRITDIVLGQDVSSVWPSSTSNPREVYSLNYLGQVSTERLFDSWDNEYKTKRQEVVPELLPSSGTTRTFKATWTNRGTTYTAEYWLQQPDGSYVKSDKYSQSFIFNSGTFTAKEIYGYTYRTNQNFVANGTQYYGTSGTTYRFYYDRDSYNIDYYYGTSELETKSDVLYGADISSSTYNYVPNRPDGVDSDYTWGGWYEDATLRSPYTFNTMPNHNLVLYAKWNAPHYNVTFDLNGGEGTTPATQSVEKYVCAQAPDDPTRTHYTFDGWYDSDGKRFDWTKPITKDTHLVAHWKLNPLSYTVHYVDADNNDNKLSPDKVVTSPALRIGDTITEKALAITGYRPGNNEKSINLDYENNVITFYYSKKQSSVDYTVRYLLDGTDTELRPSVTKTVTGDTVRIKEIAPDLGSDYYPLDDTLSLTLTSNSANNVITFYYSKKTDGHITFHYLDMDGNPIPGQSEVEETFHEGGTCNVTNDHILDITGYTYHSGKDVTNPNNPTNVKDIYTFSGGENIDINLYYKKNLNIVASDKVKNYDGTALKSSGLSDLNESYKLSLQSSDKLGSVTYTGSQTNVGSSHTTPSSVTITNDDGDDRTDYYHITYTSGTLTVVPLYVSVMITGDTVSKVYDGTYSTVGYDITRISTSLYPESKIQFNGSASSITEKDAGTYNLDLENHFVNTDPNFDVHFQVSNGSLTIYKRNVVLTSADATKTYDGTALTDHTVTPSEMTATDGFILGEGVQEYNFTGSQTNPGTSYNYFTYTLMANTNPVNYNISITHGHLIVTPTINLQVTGSGWSPALSGANFKLEKRGAGVWEDISSDFNSFDVTSTDGLNLEGLTPGRYRLTQNTAPDGHRITNKYVCFNVLEVRDEYDNSIYTVELCDEDGHVVAADDNKRIVNGMGNYNYRLQVTNPAGSELPSSGGIGTKKIILSGILLMIVALLTTIFKRWKRAINDSG